MITDEVYVEFVHTLIERHDHAFEHLAGVTRRVWYDKMKTVVIEHNVSGEGEHRFHAGFLDYARHSGFVLKLRQLAIALDYRAAQAGVKTRSTAAADLLLTLTFAHTQNQLKSVMSAPSTAIACSSLTKSVIYRRTASRPTCSSR